MQHSFSPIFKTFTSDIDKVSSKIGILDHSFYDIAEAVRAYRTEIEQSMGSIKGAYNEPIQSIWQRLFPGKKSIENQLIDVDALYPEMDDTLAQATLDRLTQQQKDIETTNGSWSEYFKNFEDGEKWQVEFVQNTDLQKASLDDVKEAYNAARQGAIAHNTALKQQTLSAKR